MKTSSVSPCDHNLRPNVANLIFKSCVTKKIIGELRFLVTIYDRTFRSLVVTSQISIEMLYCSQVFEDSNATNRFRIGAIFPKILAEVILRR